MRILRRGRNLRTGFLSGLVAVSVSAGTTGVRAEPATTTEAQPKRARMIIGDQEVWSGPAVSAQTNQGEVAPWLFSPGISDVLKLVEAKVDPPVIEAFIKNAQIPYNPSAAEVVALKTRGVSDELITAMLQRGAELRAQANAAELQGAYAAAPPYEETAMPYPADYGYGYPLYAGAYPGYSSWWWGGWPVVWPGFGFDFFGHRHFRDFDRFGRFHNFAFDHRFGRFNGFRNFPNQAFRPVGSPQRFVFGHNGPFSPVGMGRQPLASTGRGAAFRPAGSGGRSMGFAGRSMGGGGRGMGGGHR